MILVTLFFVCVAGSIPSGYGEHNPSLVRERFQIPITRRITAESPKGASRVARTDENRLSDEDIPAEKSKEDQQIIEIHYADESDEQSQRSVRELVSHFMNQLEDEKLYEENHPDSDCEDENDTTRSPDEIADEFMKILAGTKEENAESENEEDSQNDEDSRQVHQTSNLSIKGEEPIIDVWLDGSWATTFKQPVSKYDTSYNQEPAYIDEQGEYFDADSTDFFVASQNHGNSSKWKLNLLYILPILFALGIYISSKRLTRMPYERLLNDFQEV